MQLILAIDGDRRQAEQLAALVRGRLEAELVQAESAGEALQLLGDRVPDLIMTAPLLSPFDDGVLAEYLRDLGPAAAHVQTLRIPVLGVPRTPSVRGLFSLRRKRPADSAPAACDPKVFADEIAVYLARAAEERQAANPAPEADAPMPDEIEAPVPHTPAETLPVYPDAVIENLVIEKNWAPVHEEHDVAPPLVDGPAVGFADLIDDAIAPASAAAPEDSVALDAEPAIVAMPEPAVPEYVVACNESAEEPQLLMASAEPEPVVAYVDSAAGPEPETVTPTPERTSSFEAALAAIRAAWREPETGTDPAAATRESLAPLEAAAPKRDDWAVFDPNRCRFADLVDKLDEVSDSSSAKREEAAPVRAIQLS